MLMIYLLRGWVGIEQAPVEQRFTIVSSPIKPMNCAMASLSIGIIPSPSNSLSKFLLGVITQAKAAGVKPKRCIGIDI